MKMLLLILSVIYCCSLAAQKKVVDTATYASWPRIRGSKISGDGKFVMYIIYSEKEGESLVVQAVDGSYKKAFGGVKDASFTLDSDNVLFSKQADSVGILDLRSFGVQYLTHVGLFTAPVNEFSKWMIYQLKDSTRDLVALNLRSGYKKRISYVENYLLSSDGHTIVMQIGVFENNISCKKIVLLDLESEKKLTIANGAECVNFVFSGTGKKLVFLSKAHKNGRDDNSLRYYQSGMDSASEIVSNNSRGMNGMVITSGVPSFSRLEDKVFFYSMGTKQLAVPRISDGVSKVKLRLYSYQDAVRQFERADEVYFSVCRLNGSDSVIHLSCYKYDNDVSFLSETGNNDYLLTQSNFWEWYGPLGNIPSRLNLISTTDGSRTLLVNNFRGFVYGFSSTGKYAIWYDKVKMQWVTYNTLTKSTRLITRNIPFDLTLYSDYPESSTNKEPEGILGWLENDAAVLIYDRYDIWSVDPEGIKPPVNITKGYGRQNNTQLRYVDFNQVKSAPVRSTDTIILSALNLHSRDNGFFSLSLRDGKLRKLIMQPRAYYFSSNEDNFAFSGFDALFSPLKAEKGNIYLVSYMSAKEYSNLYLTSDFINYRPVTDLSPQKEYNWYTSELVRWRLSSGKTAEGVLYKPENFDPKKQYPIIFYYYEKTPNSLNLFLHPELCKGDINIPTFVSNGYLVFVPDIYYKVGYPGKSASDAVITAAKYLSTKPWVNSHKMGLQGYSFGGFETNYIITHTTLFSAAVSGAGATNLISKYAQFSGTRGAQSYYEYGQGRIGTDLWKNPNLYIENSSIFRVNRVQTPLMIIQNKNDLSVDFNQGADFYSCLQRLNKKAWLLSYENEGHTIDDSNDQLDLTVRISQFFDFFLKDKPIPKWMTQGLVDSEGFELNAANAKN